MVCYEVNFELAYITERQHTFVTKEGTTYHLLHNTEVLSLVTEHRKAKIITEQRAAHQTKQNTERLKIYLTTQKPYYLRLIPLRKNNFIQERLKGRN